jgi:hypothetical protein
MGKPNDYYRVLALLQQLHISYPNYNMGRHIATALDGYGDVWGLTDKEILFALEKYKAELDMDVPHTDESELDQIIKDGMNLENILKEQDGEIGRAHV